MSTSEYISFCALCASVISGFLAVRSYAIATSEQKQKARSVTVYLKQALKTFIENKDTFITFELSYTNPASISNTIVQLELIVFYADEHGVIRETYLYANDRPVFPSTKSQVKQLIVPLNIPARSTETGWISFKFSDFLKDKNIKKYVVSGTTSDSQRITVESYILKEVVSYDKISY